MSEISTRPAELVLGREQFRSHDMPDQACPEVIDITGRGRILVYGPWMQLEPGVWNATVSFELCEEAARRRFAIQFGSSASDYTRVDPPHGIVGRHDVEIAHYFGEEEPFEVRLWVMGAAFHGELRFLGVKLKRIADRPEDV